ncbi:hypothetical protein VNI00_000534 [Paramarasmius palmivorus]|uniref:Plasmid pRiA4b Orf3-like domain-containing protein n=1 Tax=Paramarasmius palmivorus TaxID=297713 RepID=A0AAW0E5M8_9AGAR
MIGRKSYTFEIDLLGSSNPKITRTVDVPAWFTFQELHFVIQYAFGPWQQCHLHEFSYSTSAPNRTGRISLAADKTVLKILAEGEAPDPYIGLFGGRNPPHLYEKQVKLSDIYDLSGTHRSRVVRDGAVLPLVYLYDFGKVETLQDNWEHLVTFKRERMATADRPLFSKAVGYPPAEDAGGVSGWEEVKKAFAAEHPTRDQLERRRWAIERMGYENRKDPLAVGDKYYSPFNEVNVVVMNYEGRWENHYNGYREELGEKVEDDFDHDSLEDELDVQSMQL